MSWRQVGISVHPLIDSIAQIVKDEQNNGEQNLPFVLSHQLVRLKSHEFNVVLNEQCSWYSETYTLQKSQRLQEELWDLCRAYSVEFVLKNKLNSHNYRTSFEDGWNPLQGRFNTIKDFYGGLASIFPGTSTVESDFSVINYEKNIYQAALTYSSLGGILYCKQLKKLERLQTTL